MTTATRIRGTVPFPVVGTEPRKAMFTGFCARGHERLDFDGQPEAFEEHMTGVHGARRLVVGGASRAVNGDGSWYPAAWKGGRMPQPYPWTPPRRSAPSARRAAEAAA